MSNSSTWRYILFLYIWDFFYTRICFSLLIKNTILCVITIWLTISNTFIILASLIFWTKNSNVLILCVEITRSSYIITISIYTYFINTTSRTAIIWRCCRILRSINTNIIRISLKSILLTPFSLSLTIITIWICTTLVI